MIDIEFDINGKKVHFKSSLFGMETLEFDRKLVVSKKVFSQNTQHNFTTNVDSHEVHHEFLAKYNWWDGNYHIYWFTEYEPVSHQILPMPTGSYPFLILSIFLLFSVVLLGIIKLTWLLPLEAQIVKFVCLGEVFAFIIFLKKGAPRIIGPIVSKHHKWYSVRLMQKEKLRMGKKSISESDIN